MICFFNPFLCNWGGGGLFFFVFFFVFFFGSGGGGGCVFMFFVECEAAAEGPYEAKLRGLYCITFSAEAEMTEEIKTYQAALAEYFDQYLSGLFRDLVDDKILALLSVKGNRVFEFIAIIILSFTIAFM